jgi:hypothetical protein
LENDLARDGRVTTGIESAPTFTTANAFASNKRLGDPYHPGVRRWKII